MVDEEEVQFLLEPRVLLVERDCAIVEQTISRLKVVYHDLLVLACRCKELFSIFL